MNDQTEQNEVVVSTELPLSTPEMLQRSFAKVGGWLGEEARKAYLRGELPGKDAPIP